MPGDLSGLQGFVDFGMTTLSYQQGEWDMYATALYPKIFVVLDRSQKSTEIFDSNWQS